MDQVELENEKISTSFRHHFVENHSNTTDSSPKLTEEYIVWRKADHLLRGWLIGTLSEETLSLVVSPDLAFAVWNALKNEYAKDSQEQEFTLRQQVAYLHKENDKTIGEHIWIFKGLCDNLAAIENQFKTKKRYFVSSQVLALNMKSSLSQCWNH